MKRCSICDARHYAKGYCNPHYQRWRKHGDPHEVRPTWSEERLVAGFWAKVQRGEQWQCWEWMGVPNSNGYGQVRFMGKKTTPHRVAYRLVMGDFDEALHIDHLCRNKTCVNPWHLDPVTPGENTRRADKALGIRSAATHCVNGHSLADAYQKKAGRACAECARQYTRRRTQSLRSTA